MRHLEIPEIRVEKFELANGLTLLVSEQHYAGVASVQAWCQTGSIHEQEWLGGGLTHLLEHMLFKGTARRTATDISEERIRELAFPLKLVDIKVCAVTAIWSGLKLVIRIKDRK